MGKLRSLLCSARAEGSAVAAINVVDDVSMVGVLRAAVDLRAPVIVQMAVRTAQFWGYESVAARFDLLSRTTGAEAVLHLDHCHDPVEAVRCFAAGWHSVLFDASHLPYDRALDVTTDVVRAAACWGADVEGEFEPVPSAAEEAVAVPPIEVESCARFVEETGVCCLAPSIGTVHGRPRSEPDVDLERAWAISKAVGVPLVLHGATGTPKPVVRSLIEAGVAKVNVSTALKEAYTAAWRDSADLREPLDVIRRVRDDVSALAVEWMGTLR